MIVPKGILFTRERVEKIRQQRTKKPRTQSYGNLNALPKITYANMIFNEEDPGRIILPVAYFERWTISFTIFGVWFGQKATADHFACLSYEFWRVCLGLQRIHSPEHAIGLCLMVRIRSCSWPLGCSMLVNLMLIEFLDSSIPIWLFPSWSSKFIVLLESANKPGNRTV